MTSRTLTSLALIISGLAMAWLSSASLRSHNELTHHHNPFSIQGSAYGKLMARLSETTIDRVWHLGVEQAPPHSAAGGHVHNDHCSHDHETEHDHASGEASHHHDEECDHDHDAKLADAQAADTHSEESKPLIATAKVWLNNRSTALYTRTNKKGLSSAHLATVYRDIEHRLLRSFKLDPTHYGAYDSYHLFLTTHNFGGTPLANEQAKRIAYVTINSVRNENEDPEPWLTAATAWMNLYLMETAPYTIKGDAIPLEILKHYQNSIGYCIQRFATIQEESMKKGYWAQLSTERQREIAERSRFIARTFQQFDVLVAKAEKQELEPSSTPPVAKAEEKTPSTTKD